MNGNLYCFETGTPYTPVRAWRSHGQGRNVFQQREGFIAIEILGSDGRHEPRPVSGSTFSLEFKVHDQRPQFTLRPTYQVTVRMGMQPPLLLRNYTAAGSKLETISCPKIRMRGVLTVSMVNEYGQYFEDSIGVEFNEDFEGLLKWATILPLAAVATVITATSLTPRGQLPV
mmetsp:Transcript_48250/g.80019  ORF Transcript_48250/g.80019 Transcript_48250/m.80019 type:complete len:172 (+) Transcript_48250:1-516(+)